MSQPFSAALPSPAAPAAVALPAPEAVAPPARTRLDAPDFLRGLVMVLMALDHVRDFFTNARFNPLDMSQTTTLIFLTRWVTHFCAPTFVLLAGASAYLYGLRGRTRAETARFLLTRGLWLVVLELTVVRFGWFFNLDYQLTGGQVIWAIGWAMLVLAGLSYVLPVRAVAGLGVLIIVGHNLLDPLVPAQFGGAAWVWMVLHEGGLLPLDATHAFFAAYPLLPWVGVICAGYGFGALVALPPARRQRVLLTLGLGLTAAFVALGLFAGYGDTTPWTPQSTPWRTVLSFLDVQKYPPALLYVLMTLGPAIAALPLLERWPDGAVKRFFVTFGRVPLFYYVLHLLLIHLVAVLVAMVLGLDHRYLLRLGPLVPSPPAAWGFGLPVVYGIWAGVVLALYPLCRWFAGVKARGWAWWLSYL